jgi:alpha-glucosidase
MQRGSWWQTGVIYQIYPRSFQDTSGDGIGDLRGITQRLSYLTELGVDAIWLSPIFPSPMADFGYDISDYTDIHPPFGTLDDFDALLAAAHSQGLKVILDLVPNHTSDRHPWFLESRASRRSRKRDWYIWKDPAANGGPPNNWLSVFGGSAWEYDGATGQYYYHAFLAAQPDLNWRNPAVRSAIYEVMRFWFRRGVDGFRVDVLWHLIKDDEFRDNPPNADFRPTDPPHHRLVPLYTADRPEVHDVIAEMRRVADEFSDRVLIGEIYLPLERLVAYYGRDLAGMHLPFNFSLLSTSWHAPSIARLIAEYEAALPAGGWPNWVLGNHDRPRIASRVGPDQARIAAMLLLTLRGTPTIYYGDEIAMQDVAIAHVRDPLEKNVPSEALAGTAAVLPCNGTARPTPAFHRSSRGCPWAAAHWTSTMSLLSAAIARRCIASTGACSICVANIRCCRSAAMGASVPTAISWFLRASTKASSSSLHSTLPANRSPQVCLPARRSGGCSYHPPEIVRASRCAAASSCVRTRARLWSFAMARVSTLRQTAGLRDPELAHVGLGVAPGETSTHVRSTPTTLNLNA